MTKLSEQFRQHLIALCERSRKEAKYNPTRFRSDLGNMDGEDAVLYVTRLVTRPSPTEGYTRLWEAGRLDLTCEAVIRDDPRWRPLFDDEAIRSAVKRLTEYQYQAPK